MTNTCTIVIISTTADFPPFDQYAFSMKTNANAVYCLKKSFFEVLKKWSFFVTEVFTIPATGESLMMLSQDPRGLCELKCQDEAAF